MVCVLGFLLLVLTCPGCLALWRGGPAAPQRTCATCLLRWILSSRQWPLSTSSTKSCWDLSYTDEIFDVVSGTGLCKSQWWRTDALRLPGKLHFTKVSWQYNVSTTMWINNTIYRNKKKQKVYPFFSLLHHTVQDISSLSQKTLVSFPWIGSVVASKIHNQVFILMSDTHSQLHC